MGTLEWIWGYEEELLDYSCLRESLVKNFSLCGVFEKYGGGASDFKVTLSQTPGMQSFYVTGLGVR